MAGYDDFSTPANSGAADDPYAEFSTPVKQRPPDTRYELAGAKTPTGQKLERINNDYLAPVARGIEDFGNFAGDPFGVRDEIAGAGAFARGLVTSGGDFGKAGEEYTKRVGEMRGQRDAAHEKYGHLTTAAEILGGFGTAKAAKGFKMAADFLPRVLQSAKIGAGYGAAAGAGRSEGGVGERIEGAAYGAGTGAIAGPVITEVVAPAIGGIVRGARAGGRGLGNAARYLRGRTANRDARLNQALESQNTPPSVALQRLDEAEQAAKFGKTQVDTGHSLADLGPVTQDLADTAALVSPEARRISGEFLNERARGQYGRVNDYLRRSMKVTRGDFAKTQAKLVDEQQRLSKTAYDAFRAADVRIPVGDVLYSAQIEDLAAAPALKKTLQQAREQFIDATATRDVNGQKVKQAYTELTPARFDAGKRALDDMIETAMKAGRNNEARLLTRLKKELVDVADKATTVPVVDKAGKPVLDANGNPQTRSLYGEARDVYGSRAEMLDALDEGRKFMSGDAEYTGAQYRQLSTAEKRAFRIGVAREVRKALGKKGLSSDMIGYFDRPNTREVLEEIMTPGQAKKFYNLIELEQAMASTNRAVRGNSATARRQQNILDFSLGTRLARSIKDHGLRQAIADEVFDGITKFFAMRNEDAVLLTQALFDTNQANQRATLTRLAQTYGKRTKLITARAEKIARMRIVQMRRTLAGITGEYAGQIEATRAAPYQARP
jgi:hypothetical protein